MLLCENNYLNFFKNYPDISQLSFNLMLCHHICFISISFTLLDTQFLTSDDYFLALVEDKHQNLVVDEQ